MENIEKEIETKAQELDDKIKEFRNEKSELAQVREDAEKTMAELRSVKEEAEKTLALRSMPQAETRSMDDINKIKDSILQKRSITLSSTGTTFSVSELFKPQENKTHIADLPRVFIGPNADTKIPVMGSLGELTAVTEGGDFASGSQTLSVKTLTPKAYGISIGVSDYALKFSVVNLEAEIKKGIYEAYRKTAANLIATKVEAAITNANKIKKAATMGALAELALELSNKFDDAVIVMNSSVYSTIRASATGNEDKIYLEELIRSRTIEGVPVILATQMPNNTSTANKLYAFGGRWSDMAIAIGNQIDIRPKETAGSSLHTIDAIVYFDIDVIVPENFYALCVPSA